jgi:hypothetical protein
VGKEIECVVHHEGRTASVKALLETDSIILRGDIRATLPFATLTRIEAQEGQLWLNETVLELGVQADKWAQKILHPPTLLDKLGIKAGMKVSLLNFGDRSFMGEIDYDTCLKSEVEYDAVLIHTPTLNELSGLHKIKHAIGKKTILWIVYPKGRKDITERQVFVHGKAIGLVDVKVCRFSDADTALKFVHRKI